MTNKTYVSVILLLTDHMTRLFISFLLLIALALFGVLPHAAMAKEQQATTALCQVERPVMSEHIGTVEHYGSADHAMSGACATVCLGSNAIFALPPYGDKRFFQLVAHRPARSLILHGRLGEAADRPPKFI